MTTPARPTVKAVRGEFVKTMPCVREAVVKEEAEDVEEGVLVTTENKKCKPCNKDGGDMEWAALSGECANTPTIEFLYIKPEAVIIDSYGAASFDAFVQFIYPDDNSTVCPLKVTGAAKWTSSDTSVAEHVGGGKFRAKEQAAAKTITVTASYTPTTEVTPGGDRVDHTEKLKATAELTVKPGCIGGSLDIVLVVDRSGSMLLDDDHDGPNTTRLQAAKAACRSLAENSKIFKGNTAEAVAANRKERETKNAGGELQFDRIAIVTYAGGRDLPLAEVHCDFTDSFADIDGKVESINVAQECDPTGNSELEGCWTGMGQGLLVAYEVMQGIHPDTATGTRATVASDTPRKLIVLMTDGHENVCDPDPIAQAKLIRQDRKGTSGATKAHDTIVGVVGYLLDAASAVKRCDNTTTTVGSFLSMVGNCFGKDSQGENNESAFLTYFPQSASDLKMVYGDILREVCEDNAANVSNTCHYDSTLELSYSATQPVIHFNHTVFENWVVCKNSVDLMGVGSIPGPHATKSAIVDFQAGYGVADGITVKVLPLEKPLLVGDVLVFATGGGVLTLTSAADANAVALVGDLSIAVLVNEEVGTSGQARYIGLIGNRGMMLLSQFDANGTPSQPIYLQDYDENKKGHTCQILSAPYDHNFGGIETKEGQFGELAKGSYYRLTITAGGNQFANFKRRHGKKLGSSIRITVGGVQQGFKANEHVTMLPHKDNASDSLITIAGVPKTVTRKIDGAIFNKVVTIEPDRELQVLVGQEGTKGWEFAGNGEQCIIRIEQFPAGYLEVNETYSSEIPDKDEIFKDDNCGDFGYTNPVKLQDFGGFIAYDDETNLKSVWGEANTEWRHQTSGVDENLAPEPYGVNISNVKLELISAPGGTAVGVVLDEDFST